MKTRIAILAACAGTAAMAPDSGRNTFLTAITNVAPHSPGLLQNEGAIFPKVGVDLSAARHRDGHDGEVEVAIYGHSVSNSGIGNKAVPTSPGSVTIPGTIGAAPNSAITNRGSVVGTPSDPANPVRAPATQTAPPPLVAPPR
jgi:hypothetical protein